MLNQKGNLAWIEQGIKSIKRKSNVLTSNVQGGPGPYRSFILYMTGMTRIMYVWKKNFVGICSVHRDISYKTNNLKFSNFLLSEKVILELGSILAQKSTYSFEGVWG